MGMKKLHEMGEREYQSCDACLSIPAAAIPQSTRLQRSHWPRVQRICTRFSWLYSFAKTLRCSAVQRYGTISCRITPFNVPLSIPYVRERKIGCLASSDGRTMDESFIGLVCAETPLNTFGDRSEVRRQVKPAIDGYVWPSENTTRGSLPSFNTLFTSMSITVL